MASDVKSKARPSRIVPGILCKVAASDRMGGGERGTSLRFPTKRRLFNNLKLIVYMIKGQQGTEKVWRSTIEQPYYCYNLHHEIRVATKNLSFIGCVDIEFAELNWKQMRNRHSQLKCYEPRHVFTWKKTHEPCHGCDGFGHNYPPSSHHNSASKLLLRL